MTNFDRLAEKFRERLHGEKYGEIRSFVLGSGVELADPRQYQSGDPSKSINRKLSAKHNKMYVNTRQAEQATSVEIFLDLNENRHGGDTEPNRMVVQKFLSDLAIFLQEQHARAQLHTCEGENISTVMLHQLDERYAYLHDLPTLLPAQRNTYTSHISTYVDSVLGRKVPRKIILIVSDLLDTESQMYIERLQTLHAVIPVQIQTSGVIGGNYDMLTSILTEEIQSPVLLI